MTTKLLRYFRSGPRAYYLYTLQSLFRLLMAPPNQKKRKRPTVEPVGARHARRKKQKLRERIFLQLNPTNPTNATCTSNGTDADTEGLDVSTPPLDEDIVEVIPIITNDNNDESWMPAFLRTPSTQAHNDDHTELDFDPPCFSDQESK